MGDEKVAIVFVYVGASSLWNSSREGIMVGLLLASFLGVEANLQWEFMAVLIS